MRSLFRQLLKINSNYLFKKLAKNISHKKRQKILLLIKRKKELEKHPKLKKKNHSKSQMLRIKIK